MNNCEGCGHWGQLELGLQETFKGCGCRIYAHPELQHSRVGGCAMRTHNKTVVAEDTFKLNPLKASKRGVKK